MPGAVHGVFKPAGAEAGRRRRQRRGDHDAGVREEQHACRTSWSSPTRRSAARKLLEARAQRAAPRATRASIVVVPQTKPAPRQRDLRRGRARRRAGPHRPRARRSCASRASRPSARSATPTPTTPRWTRSPSTASTRSSSRRCPPTSLGLAAPRPGRAHRRTPRACPVEHVVHRHRQRGPAVRRHARRGQPDGGGRRAASTRLQQREAGRRQRCFIVVVPAGGAATARARRRGARAARRSCSTADAPRACSPPGMIGDPDPYTATMNALQFFRVDEIVISTLPRDALGLAARATSSSASRRPRLKPVEHVESAPRGRRHRHRGERRDLDGSRLGHRRHDARRAPRAARGQPLLAGRARSCSGCCFSSSPRSWSSGPSSRPTSSSGSSAGRVVRPRARSCPKLIAGVNTAILLSSSLTHALGAESVKRGNRFGLKAGMLTTFLLGVTFLFIQINEYVHVGFAPHDSAQGSIFYGLTGLHGAHVVHRPDAAGDGHDPRVPRPLHAGAAPRRRGARASTGTSST